MGSERSRRVLGEYFTLQRGTTYKSALLGKPGPVLLGLATIQRNGGFRSDSLKTYGGESVPKLLVQPGDLYVSLKDVTQSADLLGAVARLPADHRPGRLTQDTVKLEPKSNDVPVDYLYWLLRTPQYREYCRAHATGTTNLGLAREDFLAFPALEPSPSQCSTVGMLGAIEAKIELNRHASETLESMARALFKSWFVDFDPVHAKAGSRMTGLSGPVSELFPGSFEDSTDGPIPKGWSVTNWGELVTLEYGKSLSEYSSSSGAFPVYGTNGRIGTYDNPLCRHAGIVIGRKGAYRGVHWSDTPFFVIDTAFYVERRRPLELRWAYYELLRQDINRMDSGSAIPSTSRGDFYGMQVIAPPLAVQEAFTFLARPLWERQLANNRESETLTSIRDALLARLISGELRASQ